MVHKDVQLPPKESRRLVRVGGEAHVYDSRRSSPPDKGGTVAPVMGRAVKAAEGTRETVRRIRVVSRKSFYVPDRSKTVRDFFFASQHYFT